MNFFKYDFLNYLELKKLFYFIFNKEKYLWLKELVFFGKKGDRNFFLFIYNFFKEGRSFDISVKY